MAAIHDLLAQVQDEELRSRLEQEINRLTKTKKFGLVFEDHLPECTPLYDIPVRRGSVVAKRAETVSEMYEVNSIKDSIATCYHKVTEEKEEIPVDELVCVAQLGEPIYPYLKPIDSVCNAPNSDLWHTLIDADNYHALQLLEYLYAGKVDCIYIDPPYNTGAKDWKYNNDYVDGSDAYRHSKWLSMMEKRLKLAKKLMNPKNSVLIVTIDEKEYLHLGCLLEDLFPDARIQMVSSVINPKGQSRNGLFARTDEYLFYIMIGNAHVQALSMEGSWRTGKSTTTNEIRWQYLRRPGKTGQVFRRNSPGCFYPIFVRNDLTLHSIGDAIPLDVSKDSVVAPPGTTAIWPMCADGREGCYQVSPEKLRNLAAEGYLHITEVSTSGIHYLKSGEIEKVRNGVYKVVGYRSNDHSVIVEGGSDAKFIPGTQWNISSHNAGDYGKKIVNNILSDARFTYPKSLYAVVDCLRYILSDKPDALILDFFAGSGTTLHAVNLLNAEDNGHRRCIMVTNNEVSEAEAKSLTKQGYKPGDEEWEQYGIARYVTWPRTVCSIEGHDVNGRPLEGDYGIETETYEPDDEAQLINPKTGKPEKKTIYRKVKKQAYPELAKLNKADGFKANAVYFKLGFLDKTSVALGRQFAELIPLLWLKAGAHGVCPELTDENAPYLIFPQNRFAVLIDEKYYQQFTENVTQKAEIGTIYIITDSEAGYREMILAFTEKDTYQLYRDYLDNFRINTGR